MHAHSRFAVIAWMVASLCALSVPSHADDGQSKVAFQGNPRDIRIERLAARSDDGLLTIRLNLVNGALGDQEAFYRVTWSDEDGFPVWPEEAWKPVLLHGREQRVISIVAPTRKARDYLIHFSATANSTLGGRDGGDAASY